MADTVKPLEGKTTTDDKMIFEPQRLSYTSANRIAARIVSAIDNLGDKPVVILGTDLLADFANLVAAYVTLDNLRRDYAVLADVAEKRFHRTTTELFIMAPEAISAAVSAAIAPATAMVNAALGLFSLFREDVEYRGVELKLDALAFDIAVASELKSGRLRCPKATKVYVPDLMVLSRTKQSDDSLSFRLAMVQKAKSDAWTAFGPMVTELARLESQLDEAARDKNQELYDRLTVQVSELRREMQPISEPLARADQSFADLQKQLSHVDERSGLSQLARLLRAEVIQDLKPTYLHADVVSSGGHQRISRSLLRTIFTGDGLTFSGGVIVRWALLKEDGSVEAGGVLTESLTQ